MNQYDIAIIGLGTMGKALARNFASRKIPTLVFNRHSEKSEAFIKQYGNNYLDCRKDFPTLFKSLKRPHQVIMMVPAGSAVTETMTKLLPYLDRGDIVIDGGNSYYRSSIVRHEGLQEKGIHFVGMGISGGEEGALKGPSIMPGCDKAVWTTLAPLLNKIAAKDFNGKPCVTHVGPGGAGHFVKMVHNGIEYAILQIMAETYDLLRSLYGLKAGDISSIFKTLNKGKLKSYLFETAVSVLGQKDEFEKGYLVDFILDRAGQKGTGRWIAIDALQRGLAIPTITQAVYARSLSGLRVERVGLDKLFDKPKGKKSAPLPTFIKWLTEALQAGMLSAYAEGFNLMNSVNWAAPNTNIFSATGAVTGGAGSITSVVTPGRQLQFSLKLNF